MDAISALHERVSIAKVTAPAPNAEQREAIFRAATRAAEPRRFRPWRFFVVVGEGLRRLGHLFETAAREEAPEIPEKPLKALGNKPLRAPMIVVAIATCEERPGVPEVEQIVSTGAAVQNMLLAAYALGVGAFWRTGAMAYHPTIAKGLGLTDNEKIIGYLYLGTPASTPPKPKDVDLAQYFTPWPAN